MFHQAALRITQCAEEPRLALEVLVDGTFNVFEAAAAHHVSKVITASSASVYGLAEEFPTGERHHHHNNDTFYGAAKSFNEGMLRSFRAMFGLDYVILRYFNVYGPRMDAHGLYTEVLVRWMERIADGAPPLIFGDGLQTMDFVFTEGHRAREPARRRQRHQRGRLQHRERHARRACSSLPTSCCRSMDSDLLVEHGPERAVNGVDAAARRHVGREARPRLHRRRTDLEHGLRELVEWWRPLRAEIAAGRVAGCRRMNDRINVMKPWLGDEEIAALRRGDRVRLGRAGSPRRRVRDRVRRAPCRRRMRSPPRAARPHCTSHSSWRASSRATTSWCRPSPSSPRRMQPPMSGRRPGVRRRRPAHRQPHRRDRRRPRSPRRTRAVIVVDQGGVPVDLDSIRGISAIRSASSSSKTRPAGRAPPTAAAPSVPAPTSRPGHSTPASSSRPARAGCSPPRTRTGPSARGGCANTR